MKRVHRSAHLPLSAEQMFDVVNDVDAYPDFLPWCDESRILESSEHEMLASLGIERGGMRHTFTTRNRLERPSRMTLSLVSGPFRVLEGEWRFHQLGEDGCRVEMILRFDIDSKLANMVLAKVFEHAADTMVDAFCDRAEQLKRSEDG